MSHADDTSPGPDPLKLPEEGLFETMPFGDQSAGALAAEAEAGAAETAEEPADRKKKKREKKTRDRKEKKAARAEVSAEKSGPPLLSRISQASPYTVMLAVALGSLVTAVLLLVLYLATYGFKIHP